MYKIFGLMILSLCLFGCGHPYSYQYLTTHPRILEQVLADCQQASVSNTSESTTCVVAENARQEVAGLLTEISSNIQGFGQKILAAQNNLLDLKIAYQKNPTAKLQLQIQSQQDYIARLLAICSYVGE